MLHVDNNRPVYTQEETVPPGAASACAAAATPEQAAALYDEQARKAAAIEAALDASVGAGFAALPTMSVRSLDAMAKGNDWKLARSRIKLAEPSEE